MALLSERRDSRAAVLRNAMVGAGAPGRQARRAAKRGARRQWQGAKPEGSAG